MKSNQVQEFKETEIGLIPKDWNIVNLNDILSNNLKHGIYKSKEFVDSKGVRILKMGELDVSDRIGSQNMEKVLVTDSEIKRYRISEGNVIFARTSMMTGGLGNCGIVMKHTEPIIFDGNLLCAEIDTVKAVPTFIFYYFKSKYGQNEIARITGGTQSRSLAGSQLVNVSIILPPISKQIKISNILFVLDTKIENIKNQNLILEQITQSIFKTWFVDFDDATEFEDSELGSIPKGWRITTIHDMCSLIQNGGTPKRMESTYWKNGTIDWYKTGELHDNFLIESEEKITELGLKKSSCHIWPKNTILIAIYAFPVVGRLGILTKPSCSNQACCGLIPKNSIGSYFLFFSLIFSREIMSRIATGAAQQNISQDIVRNHKVVVPPLHMISKFNDKITPFLEFLKLNETKLKSLITIRDTLLPKLMSGEIIV